MQKNVVLCGILSKCGFKENLFLPTLSTLSIEASLIVIQSFRNILLYSINENDKKEEDYYTTKSSRKLLSWASHLSYHSRIILYCFLLGRKKIPTPLFLLLTSPATNDTTVFTRHLITIFMIITTLIVRWKIRFCYFLITVIVLNK